MISRSIEVCRVTLWTSTTGEALVTVSCEASSRCGPNEGLK